MNSSASSALIATTGEALRFAALDENRPGQPLRLCVVLRPAEASGKVPLVLLRSTADARVYLGAFVDRAGTVREWLEIWVQTVAGLDASMVTQRAQLSNQVLAEKWRLMAELFREADGPAFVSTGWETEPPPPSYLDLENAEIWHPVDPVTGASLDLCRDDAALAAADLPDYSRSLHRYWTAAAAGSSAGPFYPITPGAPENAACRPLATVLPAARRLVPFNPEGGLLMVRRHAPMALEDYVDLLGGKPWRGVPAGADAVRPADNYGDLNDWDRVLQGHEHLFLGGRGRLGCFGEGFHLRVQLLYSLVRSIRDSVARRQLPLLNVTTESFRIEIGRPGPAQPILWAARAVPVQPGQAVALPIKTSGVRHFLPLAPATSTIFRPEFLGLPTRGSGSVRIRRVFTDTGELTSLEGTLVTSERLRLTPYDLLWIKLPLAAGLTDLFANVDPSEGLAAGEVRFRTVAQELPKPLARVLRDAEGSAFAGTSFETIPMLSTPCDLYALGVLAVRIFLVNGGTSLGVALDEMLSLARQLGLAAVEGGSAAERVERLADADSRWVASLGPQRLSHQPLTPEEAFAMLPAELWWQTLATMARFFPGHGPDSYCRDFGDVSNFAIEKVFDGPLADLENLLIRSRGLLFSDLNANRQVAGVIDRLR